MRSEFYLKIALFLTKRRNLNDQNKGEDSRRRFWYVCGFGFSILFWNILDSFRSQSVCIIQKLLALRCELRSIVPVYMLGYDIINIETNVLLFISIVWSPQD
jgi:hypothetical protein